VAKLRILLADDHPVMREGLKSLINSQHDMEVIGEAADGETACEKAGALRPDAVVMDVQMPELTGVDAAVLVLIAFIVSNAFATGAWTSAYPTFTELFPTHLRGVGVGISVAAGRIGAGYGVFLITKIASGTSVLGACLHVARGPPDLPAQRLDFREHQTPLPAPPPRGPPPRRPPPAARRVDRAGRCERRPGPPSIAHPL